MKKIFVVMSVIIMAGCMFQSCEKIENPEVDTKYVSLRKGIHGNNQYKLPQEGTYYVSEEDVDIYFINNKKETFQPQFSVGKESKNSIGDTIFIFSKNPEQLVKVWGRIKVVF